jgi:POT family proton-dependent oligopeptide transporter
LPARVERRQDEHAKLTGSEWRIIAALVAVMLITIFQSMSYYQLANTFPVWVQDHVDLNLGSFAIPVPWYQSVDPLFSIVGVPILFALWGWQARRRGEPADLGKIGIGAALAACANLILVAAILISGGDRVSPLFPFLYCGLMGIAFLYYWPTLLALVSRAAPASVNATMMGVCFLTLFVGNNIIGWVGGYYEPLGPMNFWLLHAGIGAVGAVLVLLFGRPLRRALEGGTRDEPLRPGAATVEVER